ncbi:MAG: transposase [Gemmataceae bacterium]|nr:transposase [Gemmataceae bacterium]MCI0737862.1 transposase [Gemmataceae bacterium]
MSLDIRVEKLEPLGDVHYGRKMQQPRSAELRKFYGEAADLLKHSLLTFSEADFPLLAKAIEEVIGEQGYTCYACAIMPDHVHMLIRRHRDKAETMIENFQVKSRNAVINAGLRSITHPVWGGPGWKVFQNSEEQIVRTIQYIEENPIKAGLPKQFWSFVKVYDGWRPRDWTK